MGYRVEAGPVLTDLEVCIRSILLKWENGDPIRTPLGELLTASEVTQHIVRKIVQWPVASNIEQSGIAVEGENAGQKMKLQVLSSLSDLSKPITEAQLPVTSTKHLPSPSLWLSDVLPRERVSDPPCNCGLKIALLIALQWAFDFRVFVKVIHDARGPVDKSIAHWEGGYEPLVDRSQKRKVPPPVGRIQQVHCLKPSLAPAGQVLSLAQGNIAVKFVGQLARGDGNTPRVEVE
jgi:hypothetical protein